MSAAEAQPLKEEKVYTQGFFLRRIKWIARIWGLLTVGVLIAATYVLLDENKEAWTGWYLIPVSFCVTFFEAAWIFNKCICCRREGCCCQCFSVVLWVDNWKKFIFYILLSVPLFLEGMRKILGIASGFSLMVLAILYLLKTFYNSQESYKIVERQFIATKTPKITTVTSEISTQTDREYFITSEQEKPKQDYGSHDNRGNPFENGDDDFEPDPDHRHLDSKDLFKMPVTRPRE